MFTGHNHNHSPLLMIWLIKKGPSLQYFLTGDYEQFQVISTCIRQLLNADLGSLDMDYKWYKNNPFVIELTRLSVFLWYIVNEITWNGHGRARGKAREIHESWEAWLDWLTAGFFQKEVHALFLFNWHLKFISFHVERLGVSLSEEQRASLFSR